MPLPVFLVPEQIVEANGEAGPVPLGLPVPPLLEVTLGIVDAIEQQSLDVEIYASPDGTIWPAKPLITFPQKFYQGMSKLFVDLSGVPETQYLRANWKVNRWGHWKTPPRFRFYVFADKSA